jgi:hypothetical protein
VAGSASHSAGTFTVTGSGLAVSGTADQFHFVYRTLAGDGQIIARVVSMQNTNVKAKAGVMIRENLTAGSANVMMAVQPFAGIQSFQRRPTAGASTYGANLTGATVPYWFKLVRLGNTFSGYKSANGVSWTPVGASQTVAMPATVLFGLALASGDNATLNTSTFDNVSVGPYP